MIRDEPGAPSERPCAKVVPPVLLKVIWLFPVRTPVLANTSGALLAIVTLALVNWTGLGSVSETAGFSDPPDSTRGLAAAPKTPFLPITTVPALSEVTPA